MIRCTRCLYPDSRPDAHFVAGVCSACRSFDQRKEIDWTARALDLAKELEIARSTGTNVYGTSVYDCIVPISGGKDSTFQVLKMKEMGATVLGVCAGTDMLSAIGRRNLDNLKRLIDVIEVTPNIEVRKRLIRIGLERVGDMSWPEHCAIWSIPTGMAHTFGIKLIVWGEQPQREYSNPDGVVPATNLDAAWVQEFGGMNGLRPQDLIDEGLFTDAEMAMFEFPDGASLARARVKGIWLGDYLDWDGAKNALIAQNNGFEALPFPVEGSIVGWENIDNHVTALRDYLRFLKYGYGRATDIASNHIRRGRLTRAEGMALIQKAEVFPQTSLGMPWQEVVEWCGIGASKFLAQCERWTNPALFEYVTGTSGGRTFIRQRRADNLTPVLKAPGYEL